VWLCLGKPARQRSPARPGTLVWQTGHVGFAAAIFRCWGCYGCPWPSQQPRSRGTQTSPCRWCWCVPARPHVLPAQQPALRQLSPPHAHRSHNTPAGSFPRPWHAVLGYAPWHAGFPHAPPARSLRNACSSRSRGSHSTSSKSAWCSASPVSRHSRSYSRQRSSCYSPITRQGPLAAAQEARRAARPAGRRSACASSCL
jgi:hypothetical protein